MLKDQQFTTTPPASSGLAWHFTDTRTPQGRVRVLLHGPHLSAAVTLLTEGANWASQYQFASLHDTELGLAWLTELPQELYLQALSDLQTQRQFFSHYAA